MLVSSLFKSKVHQLLEALSESETECVASFDKTNPKHTNNAVIAARITGTALSFSLRFILET